MDLPTNWLSVYCSRKKREKFEKMTRVGNIKLNKELDLVNFVHR